MRKEYIAIERKNIDIIVPTILDNIKNLIVGSYLYSSNLTEETVVIGEEITFGDLLDFFNICKDVIPQHYVDRFERLCMLREIIK